MCYVRELHPMLRLYQRRSLLLTYRSLHEPLVVVILLFFVNDKYWQFTLYSCPVHKYPSHPAVTVNEGVDSFKFYVLLLNHPIQINWIFVLPVLYSVLRIHYPMSYQFRDSKPRFPFVTANPYCTLPPCSGLFLIQFPLHQNFVGMKNDFFIQLFLLFQILPCGHRLH